MGSPYPLIGPVDEGWDLSRPDWAGRLRDGRSLMPELPLYRAEAKRAVAVFDKLHIPDVVGTPAMGDAAGDWFRDVVAALFGSLDPDTGERMIREAFVLVPKKNAKTTYAAGLMLTALLLNKRPRAELVLTGPTQEVSDLAFSQVEGMIVADPDGFLQKRMHIQAHLKTVTDRRTQAKLRVKTFDSSVATGPKPVAILIDELHETAKMAGAASVIGQLRGGMVSQPEAFLMFITTQSDRPPSGAFAAELKQARAIRDGKLRGVPMLPLLYEFPQDMLEGGDAAPWRNPENWWMVTPNRNRSVRVERLVSDFAAAQEKGQVEVIRWASQHLNIPIGLALRADGWAGAMVWQRGVQAGGLTLDEVIERSEIVTVGIDGGGLDDLLGVAVLGRERGTRRWFLWTHAFVSPEGEERRKANGPVYADFKADGDLTLVDALPDDLAAVVEIVRQVKDAGLLAMVGVDAIGIGGIVDALSDIGVTESGGLLKGVRQGIGLMGAIKTVERKLADGSLKHGGQRMMAWCAANAKIIPTPTAMRVARDEAGLGKIDPLMAAFDAAELMGTNPMPSPDIDDFLKNAVIA